MARRPAVPSLRSILLGAAFVAVLLPVSACGTSSSGGSPSGGVDALKGKLWTATQIKGVDQVLPAASGSSTARFEVKTVGGSGAVNLYSADYTATDDGGISISKPAATLMAGPPDAMAQEQAFFAALAEAASFEVSGDTLKLWDANGDPLLTFVATPPTPLAGTTWNALAYNNGKGALQSLAAGSEITAVFGTDDKLSGTASINTYSTTYTAQDDGTMTVDGAIMTTKMAGPQELMDQEQAYLAALPLTATYEIQGDELWLRDAEGAALAHYVAK